MNSIWDRLYDGVKDRRYGALFIYAPLGIVVVGLLLAGLEAAGLLPHALCAIALWILFLIGRLVFKLVEFFIKPTRRERWERKQLSRDEIRVARSKLVGDRGRKSA